MARQAATSVENNFVAGLITEIPALTFPEKACTETYDCVFSRTGRVTRRPGFDLETGSTPYSVTYLAGQATTEFLWTAVAGLGTKNILVVQQADKVLFYNVSDTASVSAQLRSEIIDLDSYIPASSSKQPGVFPCSFASGNGDLIIANEAISPLYVLYDPDTDTLSVTSITVSQRDFLGIDDGLSDSDRLTESVSSLKSTNPEHYYNLLNQGWYAGDALAQWDAALTSMPSNEDTVGLYRSSETDAFDATKVTAKSPGNVLAPKVHFILPTWDQDRNTAMTDAGFTGATISSTETLISASAGSIPAFFSAQWTTSNYAFDDLSNVAWVGTSTIAMHAQIGSSTTARGMGKYFSGGSKRITKAVVYGSNTEGFITSVNPSVTFDLYGKQGTTAPTTNTDGTILGTLTFTDTTNESAGRTITSTDQATYWDYVWIVMTSRDFKIITEIKFYTPSTADTEALSTIERPSCTAFFAGRAWFGGIQHKALGNQIYFSQIIDKRTQYGMCYQKQDPAGEYFNELLADDGGVIKILEMGQVIRMFSNRTAMFIFATNGVWSISGTSGAGFKATDFVVRRLSNVGTVSRLSFVDFKGLPIWWAEDGIYTIAFDPQTDSYSVQNITIKTIKSFFLDVPATNRKYVKGAYDPINDYIYWVYNSDETPYHYYDYNHALVMNGTTGAFFPWTISDSATIGVRGVVYAVDATLTTTAKIKFVTVTDYSASEEKVTFAEAKSTGYTDWPDAEDVSYDSYFITGYKIRGDTQRYSQPNYVYVFLDNQDDASLFVQGVFDFTNSGDSGKFSSTQQAYFTNLSDYRDVVVKRLKIRGKGRSVQLKFRSEAGKPFSCIGWSVWETANSGI